MGEGARILSDNRKRKANRPKTTYSIGQAAQQFLGEQVSPKQATYGAVIEAWKNVLPAGLAEHCKIVDISGGRLTVEVDSPSYRYELHLCSSELLKELQIQCPKVRLKKIKFIIA